MEKLSLSSLGLTDLFARHALLHPDLFLARVSIQHKDYYKVISEHGEITAEISGRMKYQAQTSFDYPVVGDWVLIDHTDNRIGNAIIHHCLPRQSLFARKSAGTANQSQPIAANIDTVFICMALNANYNLRRLERYLSIAWDSGASPVVVLTKSDLCEDLTAKLSEASSVALGADILVTNSTIASGCDGLKQYIAAGKTVAFVGSSGVGKSTLINHLLGSNLLATKETGVADKGKHTTTYRQLLLLPSGGVVIDTPGMRELQVESANLSKSFADIEEPARNCRFSDCAHQHEPGCAVLAAIHSGLLSRERLLSYQKLQAELSYEGLSSRQLEHQKIEKMFGSISGIKQARDFAKAKNKRK